jgi:hypothetical protein
MRTSRRWLTIIAAVGGLLIAGSPAVPAQAATSFHICLKNAPSYCLQSNGPGNQVTITNSGSYANFHIVRTDDVGNIQLENGSGNCLRAGDNFVVKIENGGCLQGNDADWWYNLVRTPCEIRSWRYTDEMLVHGAVNGWNVWHADSQDGDWFNWTGPWCS